MQKYSRKYSIEEFSNKIDQNQYINYFTGPEISAYGNKNIKASLAARYLLKEMLIDILKNDLGFNDIEVLNNNFGKPFLKIDKIDKKELTRIHFSISHTKKIVVVLLIIDSK